jgi:hypothetical protein
MTNAEIIEYRANLRALMVENLDLTGKDVDRLRQQRDAGRPEDRHLYESMITASCVGHIELAYAIAEFDLNLGPMK